MYVWLDALTNYISALGYPDLDGGDFKKFLPATLTWLARTSSASTPSTGLPYS